MPERRELSASEPHLGNIRAALEWCFSGTGDAAIGAELAARSAPLFLGLSLLGECLGWCTRALAALPQGDRGTRRELMLQQGFAIASTFTDANTNEVRAAIERGLEQAEALGDLERQLHLHAGLSICLTGFGDTRAALAAAERCAAIADEFGDPATAAMAKWLLGSAHFLAGKPGSGTASLRACPGPLDSIGPHRTEILRLRPAHPRAHFARTGALATRTAVARRHDRTTGSRRSTSHGPVDVAIALTYSTLVLLLAGDLDVAEERIERAIAHATKYSLRHFDAVSRGIKGALLVAKGSPATGVELLRRALATLQADRHNITATLLSTTLAGGLLRCGQPDEADAAITNALHQMREGCETYPFPEVLRVKAEVLLAMPEPDPAAAEEWLLRSHERARAHSALGWELRTATTLARLWAGRGRAGDACNMLRAICGQLPRAWICPI